MVISDEAERRGRWHGPAQSGPSLADWWRPARLWPMDIPMAVELVPRDMSVVLMRLWDCEKGSRLGWNLGGEKENISG